MKRLASALLIACVLVVGSRVQAQTAPALLLISTGSVYDYGPQRPGKYRSVIFTVANVGNLPAANLMFVPIAAPFNFVANDCGTALAAGASCSFTIRFGSPKVGKYSTTVGLYYLDGAARQSATLALSGAVVRSLRR